MIIVIKNEMGFVNQESGELIKIDACLYTKLSIGRETLNDIVLGHPAVSRVHCTIINNGDGIFIKGEGRSYKNYKRREK